MVIISLLQGFYFNIFLFYNENKNGDIVTYNDSNALMIIRHEPEPGFYSSMLSKQEFHTDRWLWHIWNKNNGDCNGYWHSQVTFWLFGGVSRSKVEY